MPVGRGSLARGPETKGARRGAPKQATPAPRHDRVRVGAPATRGAGARTTRVPEHERHLRLSTSSRVPEHTRTACPSTCQSPWCRAHATLVLEHGLPWGRSTGRTCACARVTFVPEHRLHWRRSTSITRTMPEGGGSRAWSQRDQRLQSPPGGAQPRHACAGALRALCLGTSYAGA